MKKIISLILAMVMLMSLLSVSAFAEVNFKEITAAQVDQYKTLDAEGNCIIKQSGTVECLDVRPGGTTIIESGVTFRASDQCYVRPDSTLVCFGTIDINLLHIYDGEIKVVACGGGSCHYRSGYNVEPYIEYVDHYCIDGVCVGCGGRLTTGSLGNNLSYTLVSGDMTISGSGTIADYELQSRNDINNVIIKEGITGIGNHAFYQCENLKTVSLPNTLEIIDEYAFDGCSRLEKVNMPNSVNSIGLYAFDDCFALSEIEIPASVSFIDMLAFSYCNNLTATLHRTENTEIGYGAFKDVKKLTVMVPLGWDGDQNSFDAKEYEYITDTTGPEDGYYIIRSALDPDFCLDIEGGAKYFGANLHLLPAANSTAKIFEIKRDGNAYKIIAAHSGMVLDVDEGSTNEGTNIQQRVDYGDPNQRWIFEKTLVNNGYCIHTVQGGAGWMDAEGCVNGGMPQANGSTNVYSWSFTGNPNQQWILEKVEYNPSATGSTISEGNGWIVAGIGAVVVIAVAAVVIAKKKKKIAE